ncbi:MAG: CoA transferase [Gemmatimonadaceae bacterium]|nr:CoA transferase [Gemmatimonadaceae bacterium]
MKPTDRSDAASRPLPLAGIRVLDLSRLLPGPLCAQHLADLGAYVIKIEDPKVGDYVRPAVRTLANRGKDALALDLKAAEGREIFLRLLDDADVVLESFRPGVMERLGLGYDVLSARRPAIVHCAITGYGQHGPRQAAAGHDINYLAVTGVLDQTGSAEGPPVIPGFLISDILGGTLTAAMGILAALMGARATGKGRYVDVSMADAVMAHCVLPLAEFNESRAVHARGRGTHTGGVPRYNLYAASDGRYLAVGAQERKFWDALCDALGLAHLKPLHQATGMEADQVKRELREAFARRSAAEWIAVLGPLDCCVSQVLSVEEALSDAGFVERGTIRHRGDGTASTFGFPLLMSDFACPADRPSPAHGEHSEAILSRLGYARSEIDVLRTRGIIGINHQRRRPWHDGK